HLRGGCGERPGQPGLAGGAVREGLPDQLPAVHRVRSVRGGVPHPSAHADVLLRDGVGDARGGHLHQGTAPRGAAAARHGGSGSGGVSMIAGIAPDWVVFWIFAPISVVSAAAMLFQRNAIHSALLLIVNFFTLEVFFLILGSTLLFEVQILEYAGAIMVMFLFVIMRLGVTQH